MGNVEVAWEDVISVINMVRTHLIIIAIAFIAMIAVMIIVRKKEKLIKENDTISVILCFLTHNSSYIKCGCCRNFVQHVECRVIGQRNS